MLRNIVFIGFWGLAVAATLAHNLYMHKQDERLKAQNTPECQAFSELPNPTSHFGFRRYKQEDKGMFHRRLADCEASISTQ